MSLSTFTTPVDLHNTSDINDIDFSIRDYIIRLNKSGIKTYWSCSGLDKDHLVFSDDRKLDHQLLDGYLCVSIKSIDAEKLALRMRKFYNENGFRYGDLHTPIITCATVDGVKDIPCYRFNIEKRLGEDRMIDAWANLIDILIELTGPTAPIILNTKDARNHMCKHNYSLDYCPLCDDIEGDKARSEWEFNNNEQ